ncbi:hypothetical protein OH76DRAFT_854388 [Lentinus brumalis]|uniref:Uncharacterized protein n=1 Tax=Lentinus brumalis TaxID=2498619 RepID=A0A371DR39_9APHY|nr:hypothetical protein OH76DRAFT_854388 [Polyporus brumalis]
MHCVRRCCRWPLVHERSPLKVHYLLASPRPSRPAQQHQELVTSPPIQASGPMPPHSRTYLPFRASAASLTSPPPILISRSLMTSTSPWTWRSPCASSAWLYPPSDINPGRSPSRTSKSTTGATYLRVALALRYPRGLLLAGTQRVCRAPLGRQPGGVIYGRCEAGSSLVGRLCPIPRSSRLRTQKDGTWRPSPHMWLTRTSRMLIASDLDPYTVLPCHIGVSNKRHSTER